MEESQLRPFREWVGKRGLGSRSTGDVCSRVRRLEGLVDLERARTVEELSVALIRSEPFRGLSGSVRSQLKRAGQLWIEYRRGQG